MNFSPALFTNPTTSFSPKTHNYISLHPTTHPPLVVVLQPPSALQNTTKRTDRAALAPLTHTHTYLRLLIRARCYFSPDNRARNTAPLISSPLSLSPSLSVRVGRPAHMIATSPPPRTFTRAGARLRKSKYFRIFSQRQSEDREN